MSWSDFINDSQNEATLLFVLTGHFPQALVCNVSECSSRVWRRATNSPPCFPLLPCDRCLSTSVSQQQFSERHSPPSLVPLHPSLHIFRGAWRYRVSSAEKPMRPSSCAAQSPEERERQEDSHSAVSPPCTPRHHIQPRLLHTKANNATVKAIVDIQHFLNS